MAGLTKEIRLAARGLRRRPLFTLVVVGTLALAIGANAAIFGAIDAVFLADLAVVDPERVVELFSTSEHDAGAGGGLLSALAPHSYPNFRDLRDRAASYAELVVHQNVQVGIAGGGGEPEQVTAEVVGARYFELLGVETRFGPGFRGSDDTPGAHPLAILSHDLWQERYGGRREVVGETVRVNGQPFTVTGVAPPGFRGTNALASFDLWLPLSMYDHLVPTAWVPFKEHRRGLFFGVVGRLRPGVTLEQAAGELDRLAAQLAAEHPDWNRGRGATLLPLPEARVPPFFRDQAEQAATLLMGAVALVLLVACVNVAGLVLARAAARRKETAVRLSLGAQRRHLVRQLALETGLLAAGGGLAGLAVASGGARLLYAFSPPFFADLPVPGLEPRVLLFTAGLVLLTALLVGLAPLLQALRPDLLEGLKNQAPAERFSSWLHPRRLLLVAQVALSFLILGGALLFLQNLGDMRRIDPGFDATRLVVATLNPAAQGLPAERIRGFAHRIEEEVAALPGVESVALAEAAPLAFNLFRRVLLPGQSPDEGVLVAVNAVGPRYFETLGVERRAGRVFSEHDRPDTRPVAVINQTMARSLWPDAEPVGQRFHFSGEEEPLEVVGVVADGKYLQLREDAQPYIYLALAQRPAATLAVHVRTGGRPEALVEPLRRTLRRLEPEVPVSTAQPAEELLATALWAPRTAASLLGLFGGVALLLASLGLYAVLATVVAQQRRDLGIRKALGAGRAQLVRLVLRQGLVLAGAGIAVGLAAAPWVFRRAEGLLYAGDPIDPASLGGAVLILVAVALLACWLPARRAARVDPAGVLRSDL
ncbi:MAG TPA: ABC transporter permease [Thermoanaerobaculia bacterium]|nr:ABC transporter permease [Thermoanaerobaculia bacterium]